MCINECFMNIWFCSKRSIITCALTYKILLRNRKTPRAFSEANRGNNERRMKAEAG